MNLNTRPLGTSGGPMTARLTVLGTGRMGSAIARRLAESGYDLTLWNRTRANAEALGIGRVVATPAEAVAEAAIVISSLTGPDAVDAVYRGADGALQSAGSRLFVEMSTAGPDAASELAQDATEHGARLLVAPILGAPIFVAAGSATILAGGADADLEAARPMLERLGTVRHVGGVSQAPLLKLLANSLLAIAAAGAAELQVAGEASALDPDVVFWVLSHVAPGLAPRRDGYLGARQPTLFALRDLRKDLVLAEQQMAVQTTHPSMRVPARELVDDAAERTPNEDIAALTSLFRTSSRP